MSIKIDTREHDLFKICEWTKQVAPKYKDVQLISETLPLGDIIINDGTNDCIIIERKTLSDLAASIKDGRYEEQSYRLNGLNHHNHNIIYLIEGDMHQFNTFKERIDKQTLYSAMFSINYFKGFSLMRSNGIEETALIACNMAFKLVANLALGKRGFYSNNLSNDINNTNDADNTNDTDNTNESSNTNDAVNKASDKDYCSVVKKVKKDNITPENIGEIMLCQIPGISVASALAILAQFNTLPNLIKNIQEDPTCLNNICTTDANGKNRKISKTAIASIIKFLGN